MYLVETLGTKHQGEPTMKQQKGKIPAHVKPREFNHPKENHPIILILRGVEEPRQPSCNFRHSLVSILFISLVGVLCGAKDWEEIIQAAEGMIDWIGRYIDISEGIPTVKTCKRVMSIIPTSSLNKLLQSLIAAVRVSGKEGEIVAIDGKTLRGSRGGDEETKALHLLHAWSTDFGICLGQVAVNEKSNEITAFPELIDSLELKGTVVTADALNTQKSAAAAIVRQGADYVLPVKKNHPELYADIELLFRDADKREFIGLDAAQSHTIEKNAGRVEERYYELLDIQDLPSAKEWSGCISVGRVTRRRTKKEKTSEEVTFYITTLDMDIDLFVKATRGHWGVENGLHLALDVVFKEDHHRYQDRVGCANLSLLRKLALTMLKMDSMLKCGCPAKQMRAATSGSYRDHLLKKCF